MASTDLRRRLSWLITVRLLVSTTLLGWAILMQIRAQGVENHSFYLLIALTYGLSVFYGATLRFVTRHRWLVDVQLACDALIISAFIALTGAVSSYFASLYFLPIIAAGGLQFRRGALTVALFSAVMYAGVVILQYQGIFTVPGWVHAPAMPLPAVRVAVYTTVINVFAFFAVAFLAGSLAEGIRIAGIRLERASTEIANLQALNEHVINSLASGLVTADYNGRVITFNHAAEQITGQAASDAIGRNVSEMLQLPPGLLASLAAQLDDQGQRRADFQFRTPQGKMLEMGLSAMHLVTPSGPAGFLFNFQDVTKVRKLERDARIQHRLAAVGEMAAGIAHEIRNPLASVSGSIQILRKDLDLNEEQSQLMDIVLRESERLNGIIRSFLAYARPQRFAIARLDLGRILQDAAVLLRNSGDVSERHTIEVDAPASEVWYEADEGQIRQIIWNLATNGLRAMPDGGRLGLSVSAEMPAGGASVTGDGHVVISVEDEGVGIAPEELDDIFQPFHGSFVKGTGLGLAIVHRIVTDYHGEIQVTSKTGAGTVVRVRLPGRAAATV
jgi:two-component system sensor histidine kinase PilS (NtrC family)